MGASPMNWQSRIQIRRGVTSVLAMIFVALVASLTAVMAIVSEGNVRSAESAIQVSRSLSAAESGLRAACWRLRRESMRFIVEAGDLDGGFGSRLWQGNWVVADGPVTVSDPDGYVAAVNSGPGLMHAIYDAYLWHDEHEEVVVDGAVVTADLDEALGTVMSPGIPIHGEAGSPWYQIKYELLADGSGIRVTSRGVDGSVQRVIQLDVLLEKRIEYAMIGQSRIMVGKNVIVDGPIGALYGTVEGELDSEHGDPLVLRSDFLDIDDGLDILVESLQSMIATDDVDGDGRLRPDHPIEGASLSSTPGISDVNGDQYVDDFDLFLTVFDADADDRVVYDEALAADAGLTGLVQEFDADLSLAQLLDTAEPDRNGDGVIDALDGTMGYGDGVLDARDRYAKVQGHLAFAVPVEAWEQARDASWQTRAGAVIRPGQAHTPVSFNVGEPFLLSLTSDMFLNSTTWYEQKASLGADFNDQIAANNGWSGEVTAPEPVPLGSEGAYDLYDRPVYRNMAFENVRIPMGTNALFVDCWFAGVTWIETTEDCQDVNWNYAGSREMISGGDPQLRFPDITASAGGVEYSDTSEVSNNIRFDGCTFLGTLAGDRPLEYTHWRNKIQLTGATRFYIDPDDEDLQDEPDAAMLRVMLEGMPEADLEELSRTSMLLPGWSVDVGNFDSDTSTRVKLTGTIVTGLIDLRGSVDVHGTLMTTFRPEEGQGPLHYGGTTDAFNTTLGYFGEADGDQEGVDVENLGAAGFGSVRLRYDPDARLPDGIPWPLSTQPKSATWFEGGVW